MKFWNESVVAKDDVLDEGVGTLEVVGKCIKQFCKVFGC